MEYKPSSETNVSTRIVRRVATATGREMTQLPSLYNVIDPDALDAVIRSVETKTSSIALRFSYAGQEIVIDETGVVTIENEQTGADNG